MCVNSLNEKTDVNALLRAIAVIYPVRLTWRQDRSYVLAQLIKADKEKNEIEFRGYIRNNFLNVKRLVHITGIGAQQGFKIK